MTPIELNDCMNVYITLWKSAVEGTQHRDNLVEVWKDRGLMKLEKKYFIKALYEYEDQSERNYIPPRVKQIKDFYKIVLSKETNNTYRRIETPEEVLANYFHEEMKKPHDKRDYFLLERTKFYAGLFQDDEAYKKYFGKSREEFEAL